MGKHRRIINSRPAWVTCLLPCHTGVHRSRFNKTPRINWMWWQIPLIQPLWRQRKEDHCGLKAIVVYVWIFGTTESTLVSKQHPQQQQIRYWLSVEGRRRQRHNTLLHSFAQTCVCTPKLGWWHIPVIEFFPRPCTYDPTIAKINRWISKSKTLKYE